MAVHLKRIYQTPSPQDGYRVLVDRLWPRGISREKADLDEWLKEIAPTQELRQRFAHDVSRWGEFRRRYLKELTGHREALRQLVNRSRREEVTLLFGAQDEAHNNAVVVAQYLAMLNSDKS
ncbi:MAG: DUF488 domain-containing protein [Verrucomicrobiales bacterium]|nr:DUF488 domain-containing protein [Verrucomicrobiales bacterium]